MPALEASAAVACGGGVVVAFAAGLGGEDLGLDSEVRRGRGFGNDSDTGS